jgi:8-oxo-dGTP diphosphatase
VSPPLVVGAAILRRGQLLAAQRAEPPALAGGWELPGGKVEPGETEREALIRECQEELGVRVVPGEPVGADWLLGNGMVMHVWTARLAEGTPRPLADHLAVCWLSAENLFDVDWLPADLPIIAEIAQLL